jgi:cell division GTPase FtsZ
MTDDPVLDRIRRVVLMIRNLYDQNPPNLIGLDPTDVRSGLINGGLAAFGEGDATGEGRATKAAERAIADLKRQIAGR